MYGALWTMRNDLSSSSESNAELMVLHCVTGAWDTLHLCFVYGGGVQKRTSRKYG